jgi:YidC/Oxa1 family membrane protein insertase
MLSVIFFVVYTAIFPPVKQDSVAKNRDIDVKVAVESSSTQNIDRVDDKAGHIISDKESIMTSETSNLVVIKNKNFILKIDTLGRISSKELLQEKFRDEDNKHAQVIPHFGTKPLYIRFLDEDINKEASRVIYSANIKEATIESEPVKVILTQKLSKVTIIKELTFYNDGHYDARVLLSEDKRHFIYLGSRPKVAKKLMAIAGAMVYTDDGIATIIEDGDVEGRKTFNGVELTSAFDQYLATIMYGFSKDTSIIVERDRDDNPIVYFDALQDMSFSGYIGEKNYNVLHSIKPVLTNAIEYGWFTFAAKPLFQLLSWLHGIFGNWGWSIIALTIIIRVILYPLTYKGMVSMQKMKELAPKMKEIKEKYAKDPQRMNAATMDMYKKHGANPLGGCLPMLLQIPVFFAIYRVLLNAVELQGAPWILWIDDLSRMDNFYILPILMGASMFLQQHMTPNNFTDPLQ